MRVTDLTVHAVLYSVHHESVSALWVTGSDRKEVTLGRTKDILPQANALREELSRTVDVAVGKVPLLESFARTWGRELLPPEVIADPPDVLVLVPHAFLHDLPLHLVLTDTGRPLGAVSGLTYCSGMTTFNICARRNPSRRVDPDSWTFGEQGGPRGYRTGRTLRIGGVDVLASSDDAFARLAAAIADSFDGDKVVAADPSGVLATLDRAFAMLSFKPPALADRWDDIVCFVAHGDIDVEQHRFSGLLFGTDSTMAQLKTGFGVDIDGRTYWRKDLPLRAAPTANTRLPTEVLTAAELESFGYSGTELVCLLGCSAGLGRVLQADEPASLAETFLKLGSSAVIAPMWDAHIEPTGKWIRSFLEAWLREGKPKALAVRDATSELLSLYGPQLAGVLTLRGDWL